MLVKRISTEFKFRTWRSVGCLRLRTYENYGSSNFLMFDLHTSSAALTRNWAYLHLVFRSKAVANCVMLC
jgi:hypothetical protein